MLCVTVSLLFNGTSQKSCAQIRIKIWISDSEHLNFALSVIHINLQCSLIALISSFAVCSGMRWRIYICEYYMHYNTLQDQFLWHPRLEEKKQYSQSEFIVWSGLCLATQKRNCTLDGQKPAWRCTGVMESVVDNVGKCSIHTIVQIPMVYAALEAFKNVNNPCRHPNWCLETKLSK